MAHFFLLCNVLIVKCLTLFPDPYVEQILTENSCVFLQKVLTFCHPPQINLHSQCFTRPQVKAAKSLSHFTGALRRFQRKTCQASALLETLKHTEDAEPKQYSYLFTFLGILLLPVSVFFFHAIIINSNRAISTISLHNTKQLIYMLCCILST